MLYREIIAVCSEIHTKHINTLCGQNVELLNVKLAVRIVTTELEMLNSSDSCNKHRSLFQRNANTGAVCITLKHSWQHWRAHCQPL